MQEGKGCSVLTTHLWGTTGQMVVVPGQGGWVVIDYNKTREYQGKQRNCLANYLCCKKNNEVMISSIFVVIWNIVTVKLYIPRTRYFNTDDTEPSYRVTVNCVCLLLAKP